MMSSADTPQINPDFGGTDLSLARAYLDSVLPGLCQHYHLDQAELLAAVGLSPQQSSAGEMLPLIDVMRVFLLLLQKTNDPAMGLHIGRQVKPRSYHVLGYAVLSSETLGDAIERLIRFEKLAGKLGETEFFHLKDRVRLQWHCPIEGEPRQFVVEAAIAGWVTFAKQMLSTDQLENLHALKVSFSHSLKTSLSEYETGLGCQVVFDAGFNGIEMPDSFLQLPLMGKDPGLSEMMEKEARILLADYDAQTNLISATRKVIYQYLSDGEPSVERVASALGIAERTLQSRLKKMDSSFQQVLDGLRKTLASLYLLDQRLSLTDVAFLLGFAEQSSFSRAYRRWFGVSPQQARQQQSPLA